MSDKFGPGPWNDEPDRVQWRYGTVPCLMVRNAELGHWCGYAAVPPGHPWHGSIDPPADVHGGISYAAACNDDVCHVPEPGEPADVWWIGFDCAHFGDLSPLVWAIRPFDPHDGAYRDMAYVRQECEQLAEQILEAAP
jgi:hypothetical protein